MPIPAGTGLTRRSMLLRSRGPRARGLRRRATLTPQAFEAAVAEAAGDHKVARLDLHGRRRRRAEPARAGRPTRATSRCARRCGCSPGAGPAFAGDTRLHWHPSAQGLRELWDDAGVGVAVAPAIGYDSPNQSHFTSRHFWEVGATDPERDDRLARPLPRPRRQPERPDPGPEPRRRLSPQLATSSVAVAATDTTSATTSSRRAASGAREQTRHARRVRRARRGALAPTRSPRRRARRRPTRRSSPTDLASVATRAARGRGLPGGDDRLQDRLQAVARLLGTTNASGDTCRCAA